MKDFVPLFLFLGLKTAGIAVNAVLDRNVDSDGIIKKNGARNGGMDNGYDGREHENLRGTERKVQGRRESDGLNRISGQAGQPKISRSRSGVRASLLAAQQTKNFESINPTIHIDEW